jgi:hypothetical protein
MFSLDHMGVSMWSGFPDTHITFYFRQVGISIGLLLRFAKQTVGFDGFMGRVWTISCVWWNMVGVITYHTKTLYYFLLHFVIVVMEPSLLVSVSPVRSYFDLKDIDPTRLTNPMK